MLSSQNKSPILSIYVFPPQLVRLEGEKKKEAGCCIVLERVRVEVRAGALG